MPTEGDHDRDYLRAGEVADLLHVSTKTVGRWARAGKLGHVATLGGHRRYPRRDIERLAARLGHAHVGPFGMVYDRS